MDFFHRFFKVLIFFYLFNLSKILCEFEFSFHLRKYSLVSLRFIEEKKAEVEILLKNLEEIKSSGYFYPIIYKKDSLWGIYPAQKQPKYKKLDKFVGYLARFETIEGKKGWVDYWGKEYYDE